LTLQNRADTFPPPMPPLVTRDRLVALLDAAPGNRIAIVGDAMLDVYLRGDVDRISPEAPVPVVRVRDRELALGGAANVANNVIALGAGCELACVVGTDAAGAQVRAMLEAAGVEPRGVVVSSRPTTTKTRVVARAQQLLRFDEEEDVDIAERDLERLREAIESAVDDADALVLEDYNKGVLTPAVIAHAIERARARVIPVVVDPKYRNFFAYRGATVFKPNRRELEAALGAAVDLEHLDGLPSMVERLGVEHIVLTLSERGIAVSDGGEVQRIPPVAREVYDVVGAGDTVTAYLAVMLASGATVLEAAVIANYAAGVEVGKSGAATVGAEEVVAEYDLQVEIGRLGV
jgi:D-beta-D-heptose 7-phosphate kinase/D-beta-D-heptose 1-phosphate adenosyltransferase